MYDLHQCLVVARKRLVDNTGAPNDSNGLDPVHAAPSSQVFLVSPVPFFGGRVRNLDILGYCRLALLMLSEIYQHSDNDLAAYITPGFAGIVSKYLQEILAQMAMKFFGYTRAQAYDPAFALKDTDFSGYNPAAWQTSVEMTEERPPVQWWPTQNDLSGIRALPINDALLLCTRWPVDDLLATGDQSVWPVLAPAAMATPRPRRPAPAPPRGLRPLPLPPRPPASRRLQAKCRKQ